MAILIFVVNNELKQAVIDFAKEKNLSQGAVCRFALSEFLEKENVTKLY